MGLFRSAPEPPSAPSAGEREAASARAAIISDLAGRIHDGTRADQVRALPGGQEMVAEAVRRAAGQRGWQS